MATERTHAQTVLFKETKRGFIYNGDHLSAKYMYSELGGGARARNELHPGREEEERKKTKMNNNKTCSQRGPARETRGP